MEKTISITLNSIVFDITEEAYAALKEYLDSIKRHYGDYESAEILSDIEASMAEKFSARLNPSKKVINENDVREVVSVMGRVEDFENEERSDSAGEKKEENADRKERERESIPRKLYRDTEDTIIAGVCSGIASYFAIDPVFVRIIFILLIFADGFGIIAYLILWLVMPKALTPSQKLEMKGRPVNLKALEEKLKEKTGEIRGGLKKGNYGNGVKRVIYFPFQVLKEISGFVKKILKALWPLISILAGSLIALGSLFGIAALTFLAGALIFQTGSYLFVSDIPLKDLADSLSFKIASLSLYLICAIPVVFILLFGLTWMRRKNAFKFMPTSLLIGIWMVSLVSFGLSAFELAPEVRNKISEFEHAQAISRQYNDQVSKNFRIGIDGNVKVIRGDDYALTVKGAEKAVEKLSFENKEGELVITQSDRDRGICIFCFDQPLDITIQTPELESLKIFGRTRGEVAGFEGKDLTVNAGESASAKVHTAGGRLKSYAAGVGRIEVTGSPEYLSAVLEGNGRFFALELAAKEVKVQPYYYSRATLGGSAEKLEIDLENGAELYAFELVADSADIKASGHSNAEVYATGTLKALIRDDARVYYRGEPAEVDKTIVDEGRLLRAGEDENARRGYFEKGYYDEEGNYKIYHGYYE